MEYKLWLLSNVYAPYDGTLLLTKKQASQTVSAGEVLALMNIAPQERKLFFVLSEHADKGDLTLRYKNRTVKVTISPDTKHSFSTHLAQALSMLTDGEAVNIRQSDIGFVATFSSHDILVEHIINGVTS